MELPAALGEQGEKLLAENSIAGIEAFISQLKGEEHYSNALLQRFIYSYADVLKGHDLTGIAVNNGYYDQNHFTKEFRKFTGRPPREYLRKIGKLPV